MYSPSANGWAPPPTNLKRLAGDMNHKLIVVFDCHDDEDHARWFGQFIRSAYDNVEHVYVVVDDA